MRTKIVTALLFAALSAFAMLMAGCGAKDGEEYSGKVGAVMTGRNPICIQNYRIARQYSSAGRFELAREHYLLAYAAAGDDPQLRDTLARELNAVDLMIRSLR